MCGESPEKTYCLAYGESLSACYEIHLSEIERQWSIGRLYVYIIESRGVPKSEKIKIWLWDVQNILYSWKYPQRTDKVEQYIGVII